MNNKKKIKINYIIIFLFSLLFLNVSCANKQLLNDNVNNKLENSSELIGKVETTIISDINNEDTLDDIEENVNDTIVVEEDNNAELLEQEITDNKEIKLVDKLVFAGDIYIAKRNINAYSEGGIEKVISADYQKIINKSDLFFANLEFCISDRGTAQEKTYTFVASPSVVNILKDAKIDCVNVANNHTLDFGVDAFLDTLKHLKDANIDYVGGGVNFDEANKTLIKTINGRKYAFITATCVVPSFKWIAKEDTPGLLSGYYGTYVTKAIKQIKDNNLDVDKIIVYIHWGKEKELLSNEEQKKLAHTFVNVGADLVVGSHSHTIQEIEYYNGVPIIYSLGNFIFGSTWTDTALLTCDFNYDENGESTGLKISMDLGTSGYEQVRPYTSISEKKAKLEEFIKNCINCKLDENGYIIENIEEEIMEEIVNN